MPCAGVDFKCFADESEYYSVGFVDAYAPPAGKVAFEWFRLPYAIVAVAVNAFEEVVYSLESLLVAALPVRIFLPCPVVPELLHATVLRRRVVVRRDLGFCSSLSSSTSMRSW